MYIFLKVFFLLALANNGFCLGLQHTSTINVTTKIKNGYFNIYEVDNQLFLEVFKYDNSYLRSILHTINSQEHQLRKKYFMIKEDCDAELICITTASLDHIRIKANIDSEIIDVSIKTRVSGQIITCFQFESDTDWFGGPETRFQHWPIQHGWYEEQAYVPSSSRNMAITERYWLSSKGTYIFVNEKDPLFVDQNNLKDKHLCLIAKNKAPYLRSDIVTLRYEIGVFSDPRKAHEYVIDKHLGKPSGHPDEKMVRYPIWSTWARFKVHVNDFMVRKFAQEILEYGFNSSQIEIDDNWETCYGSAEFNQIKFPDIKKLVYDLKKIGFQVTLWIHPFINRFCRNREAFAFARKNKFFVSNTQGNYHTTWWQGKLSAGVIDFTNKQAVEWWVDRLKKLELLGFYSFKFDAGETSWLPMIAQLTGSKDSQPGVYTLNYTTNVAYYFGNKIEVRTGWRTQNLPVFVRMIDKDTTWAWNNGLPTLITTLLQMNLNGYVFVLPDMIGGNGYTGGSFNSSELPSKEMFIRWLQANVFMPSLQFSFVPWQYDNQTVEISKKFTKLHTDISSIIIDLMKKAVKTGAPINPPIWWIDPLNTQAHKINDEFLLGEKFLVAPVVTENSNNRDIYLPKGKWKDANTKIFYEGPIWLNNYSAPIHILPYFLKV